MPRLRTSILLLALTATGPGPTSCRSGDARGEPAQSDLRLPAAPAEPFAFDFAQDTAPEPSLTLRRVSSVSLGATSADTPVEVKALIASHGRFYLLDSRLRQVRGYDTTGALRFTTGSWGTEATQLDTPVALRVFGDTLAVLDLTHDDHLTLYSLDGAYLKPRVFPIERGGTSFEVFSNQLVFTTLSGRRQGNHLYTMMGTDPHGRPRWLGCPAEPQYEASEAAGEMAAQYAFRSIARRANRLYCVQPLTPVVQIYDTLGAFLGAYRRAPHFYRPAPRMRETQNVKETLRFESEWTTHRAFYPTSTGMMSVYASWNIDRGALDYFLFACDSGRNPQSAPRCASGRAPGQPVGLLGDDTLLVLTRSKTNGPFALSRFIARIGQ